MNSFVDIVRPAEKDKRLLFDTVAILSSSLLLAISAQVSIPLIPVPFTLQTLALFLISALLGRKKAVLAVLAYLAEGAFGLPVFAGGAFGLAPFFGTTGGYLVGFVGAAYVVGLLLERGSKDKFFKTVVAMSCGSLCIFLFGAVWLSWFVGGFEQALMMGVVPFLLSEAIKIVIAATLVPLGWKIVRAFQ